MGSIAGKRIAISFRFGSIHDNPGRLVLYYVRCSQLICLKI